MNEHKTGSASDETHLLRHTVQQLTALLQMAGAPQFENAIHAAEWAAGVAKMPERLHWLSVALRESLAIFRDDDRQRVIQGELIEAWQSTLKAHGGEMHPLPLPSLPNIQSETRRTGLPPSP